MTIGRIKKYPNIGDNLKRLRGELSQSEFATSLNIPFRTYQRYEAGERMPKMAVLQWIASVCKVTVDWLVSGESANVDRVAEARVKYGDVQIDLIVKMLYDMDKEGRADALRYFEAQKLWKEKKLKEG